MIQPGQKRVVRVADPDNAELLMKYSFIHLANGVTGITSERIWTFYAMITAQNLEQEYPD